MKSVSIIFTLIFVIIFALYVWLASKRKTWKNILSLVVNVITFIESFLISRLFIAIYGSSIAKKFTVFIKDVLEISEEEWVKDNSINIFTQFISNIIIGLIFFFTAFIILYILNHILKRIIFRIVKKEAYSKYDSQKNDIKVINVLSGLLSFCIVTFAIFYPVGTISNIINKSIREIDYNLPTEITTLLNNPVIKVYSNKLSEIFFDKVTEIKEHSDNIKNSTELKGISTITLATLDMENENHANKNIIVIKETLSETYLVPNFISDLCSNAANRWKNNQPFMGMTIDIPNDNGKLIYMDLLDIVSKWEREDLINNINTTFEVYELLDKNITETNNQEELITALSKDEFSEELFLTLFHNDDFSTLMTTFMNFGITTILEQAGIKSETQYIDTININNMSDEDIKNEARIFSLLVRQIIEINNLDGNNISNEEFNRIVNNLSEIRNSKLLNDALYNVVYRLAVEAQR